MRNSPPLEGCPQDGVVVPHHNQQQPTTPPQPTHHHPHAKFPSIGGVSAGRGGCTPPQPTTTHHTTKPHHNKPHAKFPSIGGVSAGRGGCTPPQPNHNQQQPSTTNIPLLGGARGGFAKKTKPHAHSHRWQQSIRKTAERLFSCRLFLVTFFGEAKKVTKKHTHTTPKLRALCAKLRALCGGAIEKTTPQNHTTTPPHAKFPSIGGVSAGRGGCTQPQPTTTPPQPTHNHPHAKFPSIGGVSAGRGGCTPPQPTTTPPQPTHNHPHAKFPSIGGVSAGRGGCTPPQPNHNQQQPSTTNIPLLGGARGGFTKKTTRHPQKTTILAPKHCYSPMQLVFSSIHILFTSHQGLH